MNFSVGGQLYGVAMELAALIVSFGVLVVSGVAATAAVLQAQAARRSRDEADRALTEARHARDETQKLSRIATAAFVRQAEAQERANAMKEEENRPAPWTKRFVSGDLYAITNTSGRTLRVLGVDVDPEEAESKLHIEMKPDNVYKYGDSIQYMISNTFGARIQKLTVLWLFEEDAPDEKPNQFIIPI